MASREIQNFPFLEKIFLKHLTFPKIHFLKISKKKNLILLLRRGKLFIY